MVWDLASNQDVMSRLLSRGGAAKGGQVGTQLPAYAPEAPVQQVSQITPQFTPTPKQPDTPLPAWGGESGYGNNLNRAQSDYVAARQFVGETAPSLPADSYNWSQARPSVTQGIPQWANNMLNQSAYNTLPKTVRDAPEYAPGFSGITRADHQITAPTTNPNWGRYYNIPQHARGEDWYGLVDTSRPNWSNRNAARYEYHPQTRGGFGEFLMAAAPLFAGAMFPGFGLSALAGGGPAATAASNAASIGSNALSRR